MQMTDLAARRTLRRYALAAWAAVAVAACLALVPLLARWRSAPPRWQTAPLAVPARQQASPTPLPTATLTPAPRLTPSALPPTKPPARPTTAPGAADELPAQASNDPTPTPTLPAVPTAPAQPGCRLYPSGDGPLALPDNDPAGLASGVAVPWPAWPLTGLRVRVDELRHTYVGDLRLSLSAPDGTTLVLVDRVGNDADDFYRTIFDEGAPVAIASGTAPFTGAFRPDQSLAPLLGAPSSGQWTLRVADLDGGDVGTLFGWTLELCAAAPLPPPPVIEAIAPPGGALGLRYLVEAGVVFEGAAEPLTATLATTGTRALPAGAAPLGNFFVVSAVNGQGAPAPTADPPMNLTVHYDEAALPPYQEQLLQFVAWDAAASAYVPLPTTSDPQANTLRADLSPLTEFGAVAPAHAVFLPSVRGAGADG